MLADFVDRADVRMVQCRRSSCFATEAFKSKLIADDIIGKELQCIEAAELGVLRFVHNSHATAANFLHRAVVRYGLP